MDLYGPYLSPWRTGSACRSERLADRARPLREAVNARHYASCLVCVLALRAQRALHKLNSWAWRPRLEARRVETQHRAATDPEREPRESVPPHEHEIVTESRSVPGCWSLPEVTVHTCSISAISGDAVAVARAVMTALSAPPLHGVGLVCRLGDGQRVPRDQDPEQELDPHQQLLGPAPMGDDRLADDREAQLVSEPEQGCALRVEVVGDLLDESAADRAHDFLDGQPGVAEIAHQPSNALVAHP